MRTCSRREPPPPPQHLDPSVLAARTQQMLAALLPAHCAPAAEGRAGWHLPALEQQQQQQGGGNWAWAVPQRCAVLSSCSRCLIGRVHVVPSLRQP